jgi:hypothetical protein
MPAPASQMGPRLRIANIEAPDDAGQSESTSSGVAAKDLALNDLCVHLVSVSAGMVGVCLTVIGLLQFTTNRRVATLADDLVAVDAVLFLAVCILSYCALRSTDRVRRQRWEGIADMLFLAAMCFMVVICGVIVWVIA